MKFSSDAHRKAVMSHYGRLRKGDVSSITVDEIVLGATNDGNFYRRRLQPIRDNLERKMQKPRGFNSDYAVAKLSRPIGTEAVKVYAKEFAGEEFTHQVTPSEKEDIGRKIIQIQIQRAKENIMNRKYLK